ncbi:MAG: homoserine dehydrogenase [Christensenellaceae bacterium]|jgi:homoserine dehydrogenase|nr:homoserine dehydrogenase [Christensenellaceae bacterium]
MKIGLLGFGVVGSGVYKVLTERPDCGVTVKRALVYEMLPGPEGLLTTEAAEVLDDPEIELIAEAMGGLEPAFTYVMAALNAGKHVVTSNKQLVCCKFRELAQAADKNGVQLRYTASAGGGVPWLYNLLRTKRLDEIEAVTGCINGTTNFILYDMSEAGAEFADALAEAQRLGYAEANPSADIDGCDLQRKCAISASLAFSQVVGEEDVPTAGIRHISSEDIAWAKARGYVIKQMMRCERMQGGVAAYVEPTLLPRALPEASMQGACSIATLYGTHNGRLSFFGAGAGSLPTGINMAQDILDVQAHIGEVQNYRQAAVMQNELAVHTYYIHTSASLPPEVVAERGAAWAVTKPISVPAMHALAGTLGNHDPQLFFAGIAEGEYHD